MPKPLRTPRTFFDELAGSAVHSVAAAANPLTARTISIQQTLMDSALAALANAAGIGRVIALPSQSVIAGGASDAAGALDLQAGLAALSQAAPVDTGRLAASFLNGESWLVDNGDGSATLNSAVPYARINDLGGDTGVNGKTHINPSYYVAVAEAQAGYDIHWVDGVLAGASGVGARGFDVSAGVRALSGVGIRTMREAA